MYLMPENITILVLNILKGLFFMYMLQDTNYIHSKKGTSPPVEKKQTGERGGHSVLGGPNREMKGNTERDAHAEEDEASPTLKCLTINQHPNLTQTR